MASSSHPSLQNQLKNPNVAKKGYIRFYTFMLHVKGQQVYIKGILNWSRHRHLWWIALDMHAINHVFTLKRPGRSG